MIELSSEDSARVRFPGFILQTQTKSYPHPAPLPQFLLVAFLTAPVSLLVES